MKKKKPTIPTTVAAPSFPGRCTPFLDFLKTPKGMAFCLVFFAIIFNAVFLMGEVAVSTYSLNDKVFQLALTQQAGLALQQNRDPTDIWVTGIGAGFPLFHYYQHLPHMVLVALDTVTSSFLPVSRLFDSAQYFLLVFFPLAVYWAMRRFDFDYLAAGISALIASLLSTKDLFGLEYGSYIWRGFGLYTQLWAMFFLPLALAEMYRTIVKKEGSWFWPVVLSAIVMLSHLMYGFILIVSAVFFIFLKPETAEIFSRFKRLLLIYFLTALVTAYFFVPLIVDISYLNRSTSLEFFYTSFGALQVLKNLFTGNLLDYGRFPVLTIVFFVAAIIVITQWKKENCRFLLVFTFFWLLAYFGRLTWGNLLDVVPFSQNLQFLRFIGGFQLGVIMITGAGLSIIGQPIEKSSLKYPSFKIPIIAGVVFLLILSPVFLERAHFFQQNTQAKIINQNAFLSKSQEISEMTETLKNLPPGRVYAGIPADFGDDPQYKIGYVPLYSMLPQLGIDSFGYPYVPFDLLTDIRLQFNNSVLEQYNLFNIRYVILHKNWTHPAYYTKIKEFDDYLLFQVPTTGYFDVVDAPAVFYGDKNNFNIPNTRWLSSSLPALKQHPIIELGTSPENTYGLPLFSFQQVDDNLLSNLSRSQPDGGKIIQEKVSINQYRAQFVANRESYLILKTNYHPGWDVTVDDKKVVPLMLAPGFIGIQVEPGTHQAVFSYQPPSYRLPLFALGVLVLVILGFYHWKITRIKLKDIKNMLTAMGAKNDRK